MDLLRLTPAGQGGRLADPCRHLRLIEIVFVDVDPARILGVASGWNGLQRRALEEGHFDVAREGMEADEPALALDAIEGRVPLDRLAHTRDCAHDERVEAAPDVAFPIRHGRDV